MISVFVVEDDPQHQQRYREAITAAPDLLFCGAAGTAHEAVDVLAAIRPDVLLVDLGLPDTSGLEVVRAARRDCPQTEIMVVSIFGDERSLTEAIRAGATGYLLKDTQAHDFAEAIRDVRAGRSPISPALARYLLNAWQAVNAAPDAATPPARTQAAGSDGLSERETEILQAVSRGLTFAEIGRRLFISPHTVATHVKNIYRKLEAHSKIEALSIARERGLLV
ncbi:MAG: response regulator transcription factor [Polaromonas sp.]|nr:response regulator transcription factor [Polaromonas sp.]